MKKNTSKTEKKSEMILRKKTVINFQNSNYNSHPNKAFIPTLTSFLF